MFTHKNNESNKDKDTKVNKMGGVGISGSEAKGYRVSSEAMKI